MFFCDKRRKKREKKADRYMKWGKGQKSHVCFRKK